MERTERGDKRYVERWTVALSSGWWSSLCTYRLSQPSVATLCSLFSLKRKIFLFSKFLPFRYLKTVVMMLTSILLLLWKEKESCTPFMSAFYILCLVLFFFFLAPTIDIYKHNMGIMVLQTRLPLTGIFKQAFYDIVYTGVVCRFWKQISLLYNSSAMSPGQR